jgi:anti-sigma-K factor RskA
MTSVHDHERHADDVGAYLLGALNELESQAFERHMESCAACRDEVERLRAAAEALPRSVEQFEPPASLRRSLMVTVREEASAGAPRERRSGFGSRLRGSLARFSAGLRPEVAWVAAAFLLAVGVLGGWGVTQLTSNGDSTRTVAAQVDRTRIPEGSASLVIPHGDKSAILRVNGLPEPVGNQVYEVWLKHGEEVIPVSLFNVTRDGGGAAAVPFDLHRGDGHAREARRRAGAHRGARYLGARVLEVAFRFVQTACVSSPRDGDLLPPSGPRDGRLVLFLRPSDLPGLHDADSGRHALP